MPQVTVSQYIKSLLNDIQKNEEHTSIDSVIRTLLLRSNYDLKDEEQRRTRRM